MRNLESRLLENAHDGEPCGVGGLRTFEKYLAESVEHDPTEEMMLTMIKAFFTEEKSGLIQSQIEQHAKRAMYMFASNYESSDTPNLTAYLKRTSEKPAEKFPAKDSVESYIYYKLVSEYGT